jgi:hypothetical protein
VEALIALFVTLAVGWVIVASLARAATLKALLAHFRDANSSRSSEAASRWRLRSLVGLNFFRVAVTVAAATACLAPFAISNAISRPTPPAPGLVFLILTGTLILVGVAWSVVNWFLSLAAVFVITDSHDTFGAMSAAADLCRARPGAVFAVGTWFGLAHIGGFAIASWVAVLPLGAVGLLPLGVIAIGVALVTLLYFAFADFLYMGRLAAYVAIFQLPEPPAPVETIPASPQPPALSIQPFAGVDPDELILSDLPAQG